MDKAKEVYQDSRFKKEDLMSRMCQQIQYQDYQVQNEYFLNLSNTNVYGVEQPAELGAAGTV
jgi:hypothetical protein